MKVKFSALGLLKKYLPEERDFELDSTQVTLKQLATDSAGIPADESRMCFVVNGKIKKDHYQLQDNDKIVVMKMGGAG